MAIVPFIILLILYMVEGDALIMSFRFYVSTVHKNLFTIDHVLILFVLSLNSPDILVLSHECVP